MRDGSRGREGAGRCEYAIGGAAVRGLRQPRDRGIWGAYRRSMRRVSFFVGLTMVVAVTSAFQAVPPGQAKRSEPALSFDASALAQFNGPAARPDATSVCGSDTETFLTELFHTAPTAIKVNEEWGDIAGAKQVAIEGPVRTTHLGPTDLPMTHIFGDDLSMDVGLAPSLQPFSQHLGAFERPDRSAAR